MQLSKEQMLQLQKFALLENLKDDLDALVSFAQVLEERKIPARTTIIGESESAGEMYFLLEGKATVNKMSKDGEIVRLTTLDFRDHPFFGEAAILGFDTRSANVVADTQCTCLVLTKANFDIFVEEHPGIAICFYQKIAQLLYLRLNKSNQDLFLYGLKL